MKKQTVLITGSTSGIGLGIAKEFAKTGKYNIVFNGLEKDGPQVAENIGKEYGIATLFHPANLMYPEQIYDLANTALSAFGKVDVLINNAGIQHVAPIEDFPDEKWQAIININLSSAFYLSKALWKPMKKQKFGRIINIASAHGLVASEFKSAYVAAKHGIVGLTKVLALEGAPYNITANAICPGYVKTPLVEKQIDDQAKAHGISKEEVISKVMLYKQSVKDFIPVELLGQMALFLASENAHTFTGTAIPIDGGWNAQ
ncbi:MAG: 3-hydroxybutyrate dehydrogenase [Bacteroidetes bacterium]|nr:MAG: 3-hydroxybutyrate dehydrogenase [Bacteroidota bacterium]